VTNRQAASVEDAFERALGAILARVSASRGRIAVAYSGGLDSAALLHLAIAFCRAHHIELFAFHIHHGLSRNADMWLAHCESECGALGIRFDARRVNVDATEREGIEQAARKQRYAALGELCRLHEVSLLLTAHHQDDQAETVLLQLLRGAGTAGLSGMAPVNTAPDLLGGDLPLLVRPLLDLTRSELEQFVSRRAIRYIEDESNSDVRYSRNALRHNIAPGLAVHFPGYQQRIARAAAHAQSAQRLLDELAAQDLRECGGVECVDVERLARLSDDRQDNLLRHWFACHGVRMPSTAWLAEMRSQLLHAREDAQVRVVHPDCEVRRHRNRVFIIARRDEAGCVAAPKAFRWNGEARIHFPEFGGSLHFESAAIGVPSNWLEGQAMEIRLRQGGEKLKAAPDRPMRSLKHHYQALDIPVWKRQRLPIVWAAGRLVFAAGVGINWKDLPDASGPFLQLHWENDIS
jgi:tRNA(Ile)-lysidine synthase